jgi:hypothetical protein
MTNNTEEKRVTWWILGLVTLAISLLGANYMSTLNSRLEQNETRLNSSREAVIELKGDIKKIGSDILRLTELVQKLSEKKE